MHFDFSRSESPTEDSHRVPQGGSAAAIGQLELASGSRWQHTKLEGENLKSNGL